MNINFTIPKFVKKSDFSISSALENNNINLVKSLIFIKDLKQKNNIIIEELDKIFTDSSDSSDFINLRNSIYFLENL